MPHDVIAKVNPNQSAAKTDYLSRAGVIAALEGKTRPLFTQTETALKRGKAARYLRGEEKTDGVLELIISPEERDVFELLGETAPEREQNIVTATRTAMAELLEKLEAREARWVAAFHRNTDQHHLHILVSENVKDAATGETKNLRQLPRELLTRTDGAASPLGKIFLDAFRASWQLVPQSVNTVLSAAQTLPQFAPERIEEAVTELVMRRGLVPGVVAGAVENGSIVADAEGNPVFLRRDAEGRATGATWDRRGEKFTRRTGSDGWFYVGDLREAESIVLVDSPIEALALQSLTSGRDLRRVAFVATEAKGFDRELTELVAERQEVLTSNLEAKPVRVVWARGSSEKGQNLAGLSELNRWLTQTSESHDFPPVEIVNYAPSAKEKTWLEKLDRVRQSEEFASLVRGDASRSKLLEKSIEIEIVNGRLAPQEIAYLPTLPAAPDVLDGTRRQTAEIKKRENAKEKARAEGLDYETDGEAADRLERLKNEAASNYAKLTEAVRQIPLEWIAAAHGLREKRIKGENVWVDSAETLRVRLNGDLFNSTLRSQQGKGSDGRGSIDFVIFLQDLPPSEGFKTARAWLVDNFLTENKNAKSEKQKIKNEPVAEGLPELQPLVMSPVNDERLAEVRFYLEQVRKISAETVQKVLDNKTLYANSFGSAVFVHRDAEGKTTGATWRATRDGDTRRGSAAGTYKEFGTFYLGDLRTANRYVLTESPIDALSYHDLQKDTGADLGETAIIGVSGSVVPNALAELFAARSLDLGEEGEQIELVVAFDKDSAGERGFDKFFAQIEEIAPDLTESVRREVPSVGNDWNEELQARAGEPEFPALEEITEIIRAETEENAPTIADLPGNKIEETGREQDDESTNEQSAATEPTEAETAAPRVERDGDPVSEGIDAESVSTISNGRDAGNENREFDDASRENLSGSDDGAKLDGERGSGVGDGESEAVAGSRGLGARSDPSRDERSGEKLAAEIEPEQPPRDSTDETFSEAADQSNAPVVKLDDERTFRFKLRKAGDEFIGFRVGRTDGQDEWLSVAEGLIGSKLSHEKKVRMIDFGFSAAGESREAALIASIGQVREKIDSLYDRDDEYAPLYDQVYRTLNAFKAQVPQISERNPVQKTKPAAPPNEIKTVIQANGGYAVYFNDGKYTWQGSATTEKAAREAAANYRRELKKRRAQIDERGFYQTGVEQISLHDDGNDFVRLKIVKDQTDDLWRGAYSFEVGESVSRSRGIKFSPFGFPEREQAERWLVEKSVKHLLKIESPAAEQNLRQSVVARIQDAQNALPEIAQTAADTPAIAAPDTQDPFTGEKTQETASKRLRPAKEQLAGEAERRTVRLLDKLKLGETVLQGEDFYAKVRNEPFQDLIIERHADQLYLTHYREIEGDLIIDGEVVFEVGAEGHLKLAETAVSNPFTGGEARGRDRSFATLFTRNFAPHGFGDKGKIIALRIDGENVSLPQPEEAAKQIEAKKPTEIETERAEIVDLPGESLSPAIESVTNVEAVSEDSVLQESPAENLFVEPQHETEAAQENYSPELNQTAESVAASEDVLPSAPEQTEAQAVRAETPKPDNYRLTNLEIHDVGLKTKFKMNVAAIKTLRQIESEGRFATPEEMEILAGFNGWGGMKAAFDIYARNDESWEKERNELQSLFAGSNEFYDARQSTENAHYTSPQFSRKLWEITQKLGFDGGRVLEPAAGIGNIIGVLPDELRHKTHFSVVEKEPYTARLAKQLYPRTEVFGQGFEQTNLPNEHFDLVISNFPFGRFSVSDAKYDALSPSIHDYFFLKSLDKVRENGLVVALTSRYTLDKADSRIRQSVSRRADLVAAFRLPETAFQANANTEVVTDLLIFRKRGFSEESVQADWLKTVQVELENKDGEAIVEDINEYFAAHHPERVWGRLSAEGKMNHRDDVTVKDTGDFWERVEKAIESLPENVYQPRSQKQRQTQTVEKPSVNVAGRKAGNLVVQDGAVFRVGERGREAEKVEVAARDLQRLEKLLSLRDTLRSLYAAELENRTSETGELRQKLNEEYDAFRQTHGLINRPSNLTLLKGDPDGYSVASLEAEFDLDTGEVEKADVFFQSTINGYEKPQTVGNLSEAVAVSLNETGRLDLTRIGELLSLDDSQIVEQFRESKIAYENPTSGEWETNDRYLSGNVREKLREAREVAGLSVENERRFAANVEALEKIQPRDLEYVEIEATLGAPWIPPADVKNFLLHLTKAERDAVRVEYAGATGQWSVTWSGNAASKRARDTEAATKIWGTPQADVVKVVQSALDGKPLHITRKDRSGEKTVEVTDRDATDAANAKVIEVKQEFKDWVWQDAERRTRLHRFYNDNFNNTVERDFDGSHLTLPGSNPAIQLRGHQKDAVWRAMQSPATYFAHEVGTGKTLALGASMMEKKRLGQIRKPVLAVMKANIRQVTREIQTLYPAARIFSGDGNFDSENRKTSIAAIANGNYDIIILTYQQLDSIPFKPETKADYIGKEISVLEETIAQAMEAEGKKSKIVSRLNRRARSLETQLNKILNQPKDDVVTFEETGIDYVACDEFHNFKNLPVYTTMLGIKGIPTARAERATNMHIRIETLREKHGESRILAASGTPITNTVAEIYNLMRYTMPESLEKRGIDNFDAFAKTFTETTAKMEATVTGDYKPQIRLAKFINVQELRRLAGEVLDVVKAEEAGIVRPKRKDFVIAAPISAEQLAFRDTLKRRAHAVQTGKVEPWEDNYLAIMTDGRLMSVDLRLVDTKAEDFTDGKVNLLAANVLRIAEARPGATQLIFSNLGVNPSERTGFSVYDDVERKLAQGGIPRGRIANFARLTDQKRKEAIEKLNSGEILVALGSTETLGTGVNAQKFITAAHNLDVPWLPAAIEQRDGRSIRQGNVFAELGESIELYRYVTVGSFDEVGWTTIDRKIGFINQVVTNKLPDSRNVEELDAEQFSAAQIAAVASGNPDVMRRMELVETVTRLEKMEKRHRQTALELRDNLPEITESRELWRRLERETLTDLSFYRDNREAQKAKWQAEKDAAAARGEKSPFMPDFTITLNDREITNKEQAIKEISRELSTSTAFKEIGEYLGFKVNVLMKQGIGWGFYTPTIALKSPVTGREYEMESDDAGVIVQGLNHKLGGLSRVASNYERNAVERERELESISEQINRPFRFADELKAASAELKEVEDRLREWKEEMVCEKEQADEIKVSLIGGGTNQETEEITGEIQNINENRLQIAVQPFVSMAQTESILRGVPVAEVEAMYRSRRPENENLDELEAEDFFETAEIEDDEMWVETEEAPVKSEVEKESVFQLNGQSNGNGKSNGHSQTVSFTPTFEMQKEIPFEVPTRQPSLFEIFEPQAKAELQISTDGQNAPVNESPAKVAQLSENDFNERQNRWLASAWRNQNDGLMDERAEKFSVVVKTENDEIGESLDRETIAARVEQSIEPETAETTAVLANLQNEFLPPEAHLSLENLKADVADFYREESIAEQNGLLETFNAGVSATEVNFKTEELAKYERAEEQSIVSADDRNARQKREVKDKLALIEEIVINAEDGQSYQDFRETRRILQEGREPRSRWETGRLMARREIFAQQAKEARFDETQLVLNATKLKFAVTDEYGEIVDRREFFNTNVAEQDKDKDAHANTEEWSLADVALARERLGKSAGWFNQLADVYDEKQTNAGDAFAASVKSLTSVTNQTTPLAKLEAEWQRVKEPLSMLVNHPLVQALNAGADLATASAKRSFYQNLHEESAAKLEAVNDWIAPVIQEKIDERQYELQTRIERKDRMVTELDAEFDAELDLREQAKISNENLQPIFQAEELERISATALKIGDADGVISYHANLTQKVVSLNEAENGMHKRFDVVRETAQNYGVDLDRRTARVFWEMEMKPPTVKQIEILQDLEFDLPPAFYTENDFPPNRLEAALEIAARNDAEAEFWQDIKTQTEELGANELWRETEVLARAHGQKLVSDVLLASAENKYAERFGADETGFPAIGREAVRIEIPENGWKRADVARLWEAQGTETEEPTRQAIAEMQRLEAEQLAGFENVSAVINQFVQAHKIYLLESGTPTPFDKPFMSAEEINLGETNVANAESSARADWENGRSGANSFSPSQNSFSVKLENDEEGGQIAPNTTDNGLSLNGNGHSLLSENKEDEPKRETNDKTLNRGETLASTENETAGEIGQAQSKQPIASLLEL